MQYALEFDAAQSSRVQFTSFDLGNANWAIRAVVRGAAGSTTVFGMDDSGFRGYLQIDVDTGQIRARNSNSTTTRTFETGETFYDFKEIYITRNGSGTTSVYVDGVYKGTFNLFSTLNMTSSTYVNMGALYRTGGTNYYYNGDIELLEFENNSAVIHRWDANTTSRTGTTWTDEVGTNDGTLFNFAGDDSGWIATGSYLESRGFTLLGSIEAPFLSGAATDVPLLVKPSTEFTAAMLAGLQTDGSDLRFGSEDGETQYAREIVDGLNVVWVKAAGLSITAGTTIHVWGDNVGAIQPAASSTYGSEAVWSGDAFRLHMSDTGNSPADSSGNRTFSDIGSPLRGQAGKFGTATYFENEGLRTTGTFSDFDVSSGGYKISMWAKINNMSNYGTLFRSNNNFNIARFGTNDSLLIQHAGSNSYINGAYSAIPKNVWAKIDFVWDRPDFKMYINGSLAYAIAAWSYPNFSTNLDLFYESNSINTDGTFHSYSFTNGRGLDSLPAIEYDNQSATGSWWIASDATLIEQGFSLLGDIKAPTISGTANNVPMLVKPNTEFTTAMKAALDASGGDLRFTSDVAGLNQLPIEIVDGLNIVWTLVPSIASNQLVYVWGDNTGASQPAVTDPFGRNAVWVDSDRRYNLNGDVGAVLVDSTGNDDGALVGSAVSAGAVAPYGTSSTNLGGTGYYNGINDPTYGASSMYCAFWINSIDTTSTGVVGSYIDNTNTSFLVYMAASTSELRFRVSQAGSVVEAEATTLVHGDGLDHFIQCHYSGSDLKIYVDGVLEGTTPRTGVIGTPSTAPFNIGAWASDSTRRVNSRLQGLTLSTSTVTTDQISIEYDNQSEPNAWWIASDAGGGSGITGTVSYTLVSIVSSIQGVLGDNIVVTGSSVLDNIVFDSTASTGNTLTGTSDIDLDDVTLNSVALLGNTLTGTSDTFLDDVTADSVAILGNNISGTSAVSLVGASISSIVVLGENISSIGSLGLDAIELDAQGSVGGAITSTGSLALADVVLDAQGLLGNSISGSATIDLADLLLDANALVGEVTLGVGALELVGVTIDSNALLGSSVSGSGNVDLDEATLQADTVVGSSLTGSATVSLEALLLNANGLIGNVALGSGELDLQPATINSDATLGSVLSGTGSINLDMAIVNAIASVGSDTTGTGNITLEDITTVGNGTVGLAISGAASYTLNSAFVTGIGTLGAAITGAAVVTLGEVDLEGLASTGAGIGGSANIVLSEATLAGIVEAFAVFLLENDISLSTVIDSDLAFNVLMSLGDIQLSTKLRLGDIEAALSIYKDINLEGDL